MKREYKSFKKIISAIIIMILLLSVLTGCGEKEQTKEEAKEAIKSFSIKGWDETIVEEKDGLPIPAGFKHIEGTKENGFVIEDKKTKDQFVWVPMDIIKNITKEELMQKLLDEYYLENSADKLDQEFLDSIQQYGGFYVSRYEMLDSEDGRITNNYEKSQNKIKNVGYNFAYSKSKEMYENSNSVVSHLMYGAEWDAIMAWYAGQGGDWNKAVFEDSSNIGVYKDSIGNADNTHRNILCLIFDSIDVTVEMKEENSEKLYNYHYMETISPEEKEILKEVMEQFSREISERTEGRIGSIKIDIVYADKLTEITDMSGEQKLRDYGVYPEDIKAEIDKYAPEGKYTNIITVAPTRGIQSSYSGFSLRNRCVNGAHYISLTTFMKQFGDRITKDELKKMHLTNLEHEFIHTMEFIAYENGQEEALVPEPIMHRGDEYGYPAYELGAYVTGVQNYDKIREFQKNIFTNNLPIKSGLPTGLKEGIYRADIIEVKYGIMYRKDENGNIIEERYGEYESAGIEKKVYKYNISNDDNTSSDEQAIKNIYGLAGSLSEWTQELGTDGNYAVIRGGSYKDSGKASDGFNIAKRQIISMDTSEENIGFRTCLYVKPSEPMQKEGNREAPIPRGFEYVGGSIKTGFTIRNKEHPDLYYVWVPVDEESSVKKITEAQAELKKEFKVYNDSLKEMEEYTEEIKDLEESINKWGGFYVSQGEMGYTENRRYINKPRQMKKYESTGFLGIAEGDYYRKREVNGEEINLTRADIDKANEIINSQANSAVVSHLMYGAEWDTILLWFLKQGVGFGGEKLSENKSLVFEDSRPIGKYQGTYTIDTLNENKVNNIWGLAGNLSEITQSKNKDGKIVIRGGDYNSVGIEANLNYRTTISENQISAVNIGFRTALYIKKDASVENGDVSY